ncbi:BT4734/BF3469 family protein [Odoribacter laneus]|uniref:BT4734/BF3469 family protein n=1 Tax=Odoribacter laneus TaxID=626933 RepID=UPI003AF79B65
MERKITYYNGYLYPDSAREISLDDVLGDIKDGTYREEVEKIRKTKDEKARKHLKSFLPGVSFSGIFTYRKDDKMKKYGDLICLDVDNYKDSGLLQTEKERISAFPYVYSVFVSPSGNGLKIVVVHDLTNPDYHSVLYKTLGDELGLKNPDCMFDESCSDISRINLLSWDEGIYINQKATPYHFDLSTVPAPHITTPISVTPKSKPITTITTKPPLTPKEIEQTIIQEQEIFDKYQTMKKGQRNTNLYILASWLCEHGIPQDYATDYLVTKYCDPKNDFPAKEIEETVKSAYKSNQFHIY